MAMHIHDHGESLLCGHDHNHGHDHGHDHTHEHISGYR